MRICFGWGKRPLMLSTALKYHPEQVMNMLGRLKPETKIISPLVRMPLWLMYDGEYVRLEERELELACKLVCIDHNGYTDRPYYDEDSEPRQSFSCSEEESGENGEEGSDLDDDVYMIEEIE